MTKHFFLGSAFLLAFVLNSPAPVGQAPVDTVTVDGTQYSITVDTTMFDPSEALLASQPWYGNQSLATDLANAVKTGVTQNSLYTFNGTDGPLFAFGNVNDADTEVYNGSSAVFQSVGNDTTYNFAVIVPVPESNLNPSLLASAGLFLCWRSWRIVRPVGA